MNNITQEEYDHIMNEHEELINLIITRTKEIANILHGRDPIGECIKSDFNIQNDKLLVQFESYYCGECYNLPLEFLFSEDYRKNYKTMILNKRIDEVRKRTDVINDRIEKDHKEKEDHDKAEYKRLRIKYGE